MPRFSWLLLLACAVTCAITRLEAAPVHLETQARLRALAAAALPGESNRIDALAQALPPLLREPPSRREDRLELLRLLAWFRAEIATNAALAEPAGRFVAKHFPDAHRDARREQARLLGEWRVESGFGPLTRALASERDPATRFLTAQALARLPGGWTAEDEARAIRWFLGKQREWSREYARAGAAFPAAWESVLAEFAGRHRQALLRELPRIDLAGPLGAAALALLAEPPANGEALLDLYERTRRPEARLRIVQALRPVHSRRVEDFLATEHDRLDWNAPGDVRLLGVILEHWAGHPTKATLAFLIYEGLFHDDAEVVCACARGVLRASEDARAVLAEGTAPAGRQPQEELAVDLICRIIERPDLFHPLEAALVVWSGQRRPGYAPGQDWRSAPGLDALAAALEFWKDWYAQSFKKPFQPLNESAAP